MSEAEASARNWQRIGVLALVALIHVAAIFALIRAFAPGAVEAVTRSVLSTFSVTVETPPPPPPPPAEQSKPAPKAAGAAGAAGKKAVPKEVTAPKPKIAIATKPAPQASSSGSANSSGATASGTGTGAGGQGNGTGAGGSGSGQGGGAATKPVHIGGQINNAKDFPVPPGGREARIGKSVTVALTVSPAGRATACRVQAGSGFPESDQIVCRLAIERLRFKPATNAAGDPVTATFYWRQRFFN
jgi:periplasmic protein TonB